MPTFEALQNEVLLNEELLSLSSNVRRTKRDSFSGFDETKPMEAKKGFTFGCDPEAFIFNTKTDEPVPAAGIIPGTKWEPYPVIGGAIQVDGMAAEFNIDPVNNYEDWENNITGVIAQLASYLPKDHELRWVPSVRFSEAAFDSAPEENKELGCSPDFNAWDGRVNPMPRITDPYVRCAGGHLHFGWTKDEDLNDLQHLLTCQDFIKQCDWFLGGWSATMDWDTTRKRLYGKMGACRYKPYGCEYRVLSNFWVASSELRLQVWNRMMSAVQCMQNMYYPDRVPRYMTSFLREAINEGHLEDEFLKQARFPIRTINARFNRW